MVPRHFSENKFPNMFIIRNAFFRRTFFENDFYEFIIPNALFHYVTRKPFKCGMTDYLKNQSFKIFLVHIFFIYIFNLY